ncbi:DUF2793 domain-containing protein [Tsuneonella amylolytica]|uniref:DUF2793 domain-containing protein n=1 Tax=Tsuneonella amylolytica TaxID=2338327 RepID=UPI0013C455F7|nr:DUF2793 domain-containing protein [Tsuneonella amylolytica]
MTDPVSYPAATPRFGFPLLFPGQIQKEAFVNAALTRADMLLHPVVEGESAEPPAGVAEGQCWLISTGALGDFAGHDGQIACKQSGAWLFAAPSDGMTMHDRSTGQTVTYIGGWQRPATPALPTGGSVVDVEARAAIETVVFALQQAGFFAQN